jgi:hypothetical protein
VANNVQLFRQFVRAVISEAEDDEWGEDAPGTAPQVNAPRETQGYTTVTPSDITIDGSDPYDNGEDPDEDDHEHDRDDIIDFVLRCFERGEVHEHPNADFYDYDTNHDTLEAISSSTGALAMRSQRLNDHDGTPGSWDEEYTLE